MDWWSSTCEMGRSPCCEKAHTNKGAWSKEEDQVLIAYIRAHGEGCWRSLPKAAGLQRCGKSCRLRWINYLRPDLKRGNFGPEEDDLIIKLHSMLGNKWSLIASRLPGRTDNEIKNYWNTHIKRKLSIRGVDSSYNTHFPIELQEHGSGSSFQSSSEYIHVLPKRRCKHNEACTDFFQPQQQINPGTWSGAHKVISTSHEDINLELSITLPSLSSEVQGPSSISKGLSGGIKLSNDYMKQDQQKREICCHIGLQTIGGSCCSDWEWLVKINGHTF